MAIEDKGLNLMVDGIGQEAGLYLAAYSGVGGTTKEGTAIATAYNASVAGVADITSSKTIAITAGVTVTAVRLQDTTASVSEALSIASKTISAAFPAGGDLIITSYEISVTSTD